MAHEKDALALTLFYTWLDDCLYPTDPATITPVTELMAAEKLTALRKEQDHCWGTSFYPISAFKDHGAIVHYHVTKDTDIPLTGCGLYLLDSGGQYFDGTTDITRTLLLGENPAVDLSAERHAYTSVLKGLIRLSSAVFPEGTTGQQLDALARYDLWQHHQDYGHGTGHGVGSFLSVHETPPSISPRSHNSPLHPGMIVSIEPGFYKPGAFGIRLENLARVVASGISPDDNKPYCTFETLTLVPFDPSLIQVARLSDDELSWLNAYHARIEACLLKKLPTPAQEWLLRQTAHIS